MPGCPPVEEVPAGCFSPIDFLALTELMVSVTGEHRVARCAPAPWQRHRSSSRATEPHVDPTS